MKIEFDLDNAAECAKVRELLGEGSGEAGTAKKKKKPTTAPSELDDDDPADEVDEDPTLEDIQKKVAEVKTAGKKDDLKKLYTKYKINATTDLKPEKFVAFMKALEALAD